MIACAGFGAVLPYDTLRALEPTVLVAGTLACGFAVSQQRQKKAAGAMKYGQAQLDISDEMDLDADRARYEADRAKDIALAATHGIDAALQENHLDALLFPGATGAAIATAISYGVLARSQ